MISPAGDVTCLSAVFPARVSEIDSVVAVVDVLARWKAAPAAIVYGVHLVVDELMANVVQHAGAPAGANVTLFLEFDRDRVAIHFAWPGVQFDPTVASSQLGAPRLPDDPLQGLGIGLGLVKAFSDDVRYHWEAERNILEIIRRFGKDSETFPDVSPDPSEVHTPASAG